MREILFKAKQLHNEEWIEGGLLKSSDGRAFLTGISKRGRIDGIEVIPETVCQYTGLTDKNGNKIWENDICIDDESTYLVTYSEEWCRFELVEYAIKGCLMEYGWDETAGGFGEISSEGFINYLELNKWFDVIGNKFDNPELLGK